MKKQASHSHSKRLLLVWLILFTTLILVNFASSLEFDNVKSYDEETQTVTITNALGLGDVIGKAKLISPKVVEVGQGYQMVAEFDIWAYEDYNDAIKQFTFTDMKNKEKINREIDLKKREYVEVEVDNYINGIVSYNPNSTANYGVIKNGTRIELQEVWTKVTPADLKKNDVLRIGIFTDVKKGDYVDWIPTIYGVEIDEWAVWQESFNTGLMGYWNMNQAVGTMNDSLGIYNLTGVNTPGRTTNGIISNATSLLSTSSQFWNGTTTDGNNFISTNGQWTINLWVNKTGSCNLQGAIISKIDSGGSYNGWALGEASGSGNSCAIVLRADNDGSTLGNVGDWLNNSKWQMLTAVINDTQMGLYINGTFAGSKPLISGKNIINSTNSLKIGWIQTWGNYFTGNIDEVAIWNRTLSSTEITSLFGGGSPPPYNSSSDLPPQITLNSPSSTNYTTSPQSITINFTASDTEKLENVTLWVNGVLNQTNSSGLSESVYLFPLTLGDGDYNIYGTATDNSSQSVNSSSIRILIDSVQPIFIVSSGSGNQNYSKTGNNNTINITINDTNLHTCWYYYNSTNTTFSCSNGVLNSLNLGLYQANNSAIFYANDSLGNVNSTIVNWDYKIFEVTDFYISSTTSGATNPFNITINSSEQVTIAYLNYNGTNYLASISSSTNPFIISKLQSAPTVSSATNISFYWNLTTSSGYNVATTTKNQSVDILTINSTCTGMYYLYNFSIFDEVTQELLNGTTQNTSIKIDLDLYTSDGLTNIVNYYTEIPKTNPSQICINNNLSGNEQYLLDMQIQYGASSYSSEFYNIEDRVFNSSTLNSTINLYDLPTANTQKFRLLARDTTYLPRAGALIQIERKYLENGSFYITEIPKTDAKGITSASLEVNDVIYNFYIYEAGVLVDSFTNVLAICQTPLVTTCEIDFNSFETDINIPDYEEGDDFNYTLGYNSTSKIVSTSFTIPSGEPSAVQLVIIREDTLGTAVCSDSLVSSSGTLTCTIPSSFGNSTVLAKIYKDSVEQARGNIKLDQSSSDIFGVVLVVLSLMVMMTLIGLSISDNPVISAVFLFVGVVLLYAINLVENTGFIGATATILFLAIATILVIVKAGRRS